GDVRIEKTPGIFPGRRTFPLRCKIDDDVGPLPVQHFEQKVLLKYDVNLVVTIAGIALPQAERKRLRRLGIAANTDNLVRVVLGEQMKGRVHSEHTIAAEDRVARHPSESLLLGDFQYRPIIVPGIAGTSKQLAPHFRFAERLSSKDPIQE